MKINRSAWSAFQRGKTSEELKEAARDKASHVLFWLALLAAALFLLPWEWALIPALMAALKGIQSFDASKLAPEIEALENIFREITRI